MKLRKLTAASPDEVLALQALLRDAVEDGASVGYVLPVQPPDMAAFWAGTFAEVADGSRVLLVAEDEHGIAGSAQLSFCGKPNGAHRAEVQKVLVHTRARRRGLGRDLMLALEQAARDAGRWLLVLDTESQSGGQKLYEALGYSAAGQIPDFAIGNSGGFVPTTYMYKKL